MAPLEADCSFPFVILLLLLFADLVAEQVRLFAPVSPHCLRLFGRLLNIIQIWGRELPAAKRRFSERRLFDAPTAVGHLLVLEFVQPGGLLFYVLVHFAEEVLHSRLINEAAHRTPLVFGVLNYEIGLTLERGPDAARLREHEGSCASSGHLTRQGAQVLAVQFRIGWRHRTLIEAVCERVRGLNFLTQFFVVLEEEIVNVAE